MVIDALRLPVNCEIRSSLLWRIGEDNRDFGSHRFVARRCVSYQADGRSEFNRRIRVMKRFGQQDEFFRERSGRDDADGTTQPYVLSRTSTNGYEVKLTKTIDCCQEIGL